MTDIVRKKSGFANINGAEIYYEAVGDGQPMILLHAGIADSRMWRRQTTFFSKRYEVITYDLRGFGRSPMPAAPYAHYRDLAALMDTMGIEGAILMGSSSGGSAAIDFALEYPERARGLVLAGTAVDGYRVEDEKTRENWKEIEKAYKAGDLDKVAELEINHWIIGSKGPSGRFEKEDLDLFRDMIIRHYRYDPDRGEEEGPEELSVNRLSDIKIPTLIVVGDLDSPDMINIADILVRDIPGAKKAVIPATAHLPCFEKADEFNKLSGGFLTQAGL